MFTFSELVFNRLLDCVQAVGWHYSPTQDGDLRVDTAVCDVDCRRDVHSSNGDTLSVYLCNKAP